MNENSVIVRGRCHLETDVGSELILMQFEEGRFFSLSGTGRRLWELIAEPIPVAAVADRLVLEFDVARQRCVEELLTLCRDLQTRKLIDVAEGSPA